MNDEEKIPCPNCDDGFVIVEEEGRRYREGCYHCANTGFITPEQHRIDRINGLAGILAYEHIDKQKRNCNENPDGEGWAFSAAESGMSEADYTFAMRTGKTDHFEKSLKALEERDPELMTALLDLYDGPNSITHPTVTAVLEPVIRLCNTDEIPF